MAKFNAVEKRCNIAVMLLNESKDLKNTKNKEDANKIKKECVNQTNEVNNMINALRDALENLAIAWKEADNYADWEENIYNMITVKRRSKKEIKNYDNLTLEDIINKYEIYHDSAIIHNGHVVGFTHE